MDKQIYENLRVEICKAFENYENGMISFVELLTNIKFCAEKSAQESIDGLHKRLRVIEEQSSMRENI
jgi:hypothetical protein